MHEIYNCKDYNIYDDKVIIFYPWPLRRFWYTEKIYVCNMYIIHIGRVASEQQNTIF